MRSPRLMVISTILNWIAFVAALVFQIIWPWEVYRGNNPSMFVLTFILLFVTALLQTAFLFKNTEITFLQSSAEEVAQKPKRDTNRSIARLVDALDDDERAQLRDWMLAQEDERAVR